MALKALLMRGKLDMKKKELEQLREKTKEFEKREAELETAINEMTEDTPEEDQKEIERQTEEFETQKTEHENAVKGLEDEIKQIESELDDVEQKQRSAAGGAAPGTEIERRNNTMANMGNMMSNRTNFFGMTMQERDAFFLRQDVKDFLTQVRTCIKEKRAIDNVGLTIPDVMLELLRAKVEVTSKLIGIVSKRPVTGTARQRIMGTIPEAVWTEMCASINELSLGFNDIEVDGYKVGGFFAVCNAIIEDNDVNLTTEIINALGKAIGKALDKAILYGTGIKMPLGIVTRLAQTVKPSGYSNTARTWADLSASHIITGSGATGIKLFQEIVSAVGVIENDYSDNGLAFVMNKKTHMDLTVQSMDKNLNAAIVAGISTQMPVIGGNIIELPFIPDGDIIYGYMDMYLLAERAGTAIGQSEHVRFLEDQTVFKGTARYDGTPVIAESFAVMNIKGTAPKTTVDFPEDLANKTAA